MRCPFGAPAIPPAPSGCNRRLHPSVAQRLLKQPLLQRNVTFLTPPSFGYPLRGILSQSVLVTQTAATPRSDTLKGVLTRRSSLRQEGAFFESFLLVGSPNGDPPRQSDSPEYPRRSSFSAPPSSLLGRSYSDSSDLKVLVVLVLPPSSLLRRSSEGAPTSKGLLKQPLRFAPLPFGFRPSCFAARAIPKSKTTAVVL